jgi:Trk K+ transport system NAD-binding subunit
MIERMNGHVVVCGLGHVGFRVVQSLLASHAKVVAIEKRAEGSFREHVAALGVPVLAGDARRDELLVEAGVDRAVAVVCATNDDLANLEVAIDAKRMNPSIRVVMRMFDQRLASKVEGVLDLDRTFSTSALAGPLVALWATQDGVRSVYQVGPKAELRVTAEVEVGVDARVATVRELEDGFEGRVIALRKRGQDDFDRVRGETRLGPRDVVLVDVLQDELARLRAALGAVR